MQKYEGFRQEQQILIVQIELQLADNILKIVAIFFRVNSGIPVLIMGETGCGKTKLLQFMSTALDITMRTIDVHGGYSIADLQRDLDEPIHFALQNPTNTVLVFLDEVNTSPDCGGFKEVICDHSLKGEEFPDNMVIIAALNPYRKRHKTMEQIIHTHTAHTAHTTRTARTHPHTTKRFNSNSKIDGGILTRPHLGPQF